MPTFHLQRTNKTGAKLLVGSFPKPLEAACEALRILAGAGASTVTVELNNAEVKVTSPDNSSVFFVEPAINNVPAKAERSAPQKAFKFTGRPSNTGWYKGADSNEFDFKRFLESIAGDDLDYQNHYSNFYAVWITADGEEVLRKGPHNVEAAYRRMVEPGRQKSIYLYEPAQAWVDSECSNMKKPEGAVAVLLLYVSKPDAVVCACLGKRYA